MRPDYLRHGLVFFFGLFLFTSTFSIALAQSALGVSCLLFVGAAVRDRFQPFTGDVKWFFVLMGLYLLWIVVSSVAGPTPMESLMGSREAWLFCAVLVGVYLCRDARTRENLVTVWAVGVALLSVYGIIQAATGVAGIQYVDGKLVTTETADVQGYFSSSMTYGNYCITAACFLLGLSLTNDARRDWRKWLYVIAGSLALMVTVLASRRGATVAGLVTLLIFVLVTRTKTRWVAAGLVVSLVVVLVAVPQYRDRFGSQMEKDMSQDYQGSRVYIWRNSLEIVKEHPVFGVGEGHFREAYEAKLPSGSTENRKLAHAHNDVLNVAANAGIPAAVFFLGMWLAAMHFLWHGYRRQAVGSPSRGFGLASFMGATVFFLCSMTESAFADEEVRQLLMFVWAVGLAAWYKTAEQVDGSRPAQRT